MTKSAGQLGGARLRVGTKDTEFLDASHYCQRVSEALGSFNGRRRIKKEDNLFRRLGGNCPEPALDCSAGDLRTMIGEEE